MTEGNYCGTSRPARLSPRKDETPTHDCLTLNVSRAYEIRLKSLGKIQRAPLGSIGRAATRRRSTDPALHILSPFDPLLIHRKRIARLFGFDFAIECYLPAAKRQFGYFALPLFWHGSFVGLMDAKADRAAGVLEVRKLRYDGSADQRARFDEALGEALQEFARFNGVAVVKRLDRS